MAYIILYRFNKFHVVDEEDWFKYSNYRSTDYTVVGTHDEYKSAEIQRDHLNAALINGSM